MTVLLRALAVVGCALCAGQTCIGVQLPHHFGRDAYCQTAGGNLGPRRNDGPGADDGFSANASAIEHCRVHPHQRPIADGAAMQDGGVSDGDIGSNLSRIAWISVDDGVILDVAACTDDDAVGVPSHNGAKPNASL